MQVWVIADTHFGHENILKFVNNDGSRVRSFCSVEEMDEIMIEKWNARVRTRDKVYHVGDVVIKKRDLARVMPRLNGNKTLIMGNHDIFDSKEYMKYFKNLRAFRVWGKAVLSHVPIHPMSLGERFIVNIHGHLHSNSVGDPRYSSVCVEQRGYAPVAIEDAIKEIR